MSAILLTIGTDPVGTDREAGTLKLAAPQILTLSGAAGTRVRCIRGRGWITAEGDHADYWINAGEEFQIRAATRVVIEADGCGELAVTLPRPETGARASSRCSDVTARLRLTTGGEHEITVA